MNLEGLYIERSRLDSQLQLLVKENLDSKELKEEYEAESSLLNGQISELDKSITEAKKIINENANNYSYEKENKLFNKIIAANVIPGLALGGLFIITGNSHVISNMGLFSSLFTGIPTLLVSTGIYLTDLKNIRRANRREYFSSDECGILDEELKSLETERLGLKDRLRELGLEINKLKTSIHNKGCQIVSIKNRLSHIDYSIKSNNVANEQVFDEEIKLIK